MTTPAAEPERQITTHDLQARWDEIKDAARHETERRFMGMTALTLGGIALGAGVIGLAFWAGRRSKRHHESVAPALPAVAVAPTAAPIARPADTALNTALSALINVAVQSGVKALTKRLESAQ